MVLNFFIMLYSTLFLLFKMLATVYPWLELKWYQGKTIIKISIFWIESIIKKWKRKCLKPELEELKETRTGQNCFHGCLCSAGEHRERPPGAAVPLVGACSGPQQDHSKGQEGHNSGWELLWSCNSKSWGETRAKPELPWLLNLFKDWYVNTQRSQIGWGSVRPLTSQPNKLYGRNAFLQMTAAALQVQMWWGCW